MTQFTKKIALMCLMASALILTGCYRVDVPQGNVVTEQDIKKIKIGMTRNEVISEIGTPLVTDPFHANRWDYFYSVKHLKRSEETSQNIALIFEGDKLVEIEGQPEITEESVISHNEFKSQQRQKRGRGVFTRMGDILRDDDDIPSDVVEE